MTFPVPVSLLPPPPRIAEPLYLSILSREYVRVPVITLVGGQEIDPTGWPVELAVPAAGEPPAVWLAGSWEVETRLRPPLVAYYARLLVGPGGMVAPGVGRYDVWVRWDSETEWPVRQAPGTLIID